MSADLATTAEQVERLDVREYLVGVYDEFFRFGSSDLRLIVDDVDRETWDAIEGKVITRFPEGRIKVEKPCHGVSVEWVLER